MHNPARQPGLILAILVSLWLVVGLACNFSGAGGGPTPEPAEALRQTLQAMSLPSPTPGPVILTTLTPEPLPVATELAGEPTLPAARGRPVHVCCALRRYRRSHCPPLEFTHR